MGRQTRCRKSGGNPGNPVHNSVFSTSLQPGLWRTARVVVSVDPPTDSARTEEGGGVFPSKRERSPNTTAPVMLPDR